MQWRDVYALRREGRLDAAKTMAEELLQKNNKDQDVLKAYAWTLIDICKREQKNGNLSEARQIVGRLLDFAFNEPYDAFTETLVKNIQGLKLMASPCYTQIQNAKELSQKGKNDQAWEILTHLYEKKELPAEAHENYGWVIYRYLKEHTELDSEKVRRQLKNYIDLQNKRPSRLHSQILNFALNYSKQDINFKLVSFLHQWDPNNLQADDFNDYRGNDGTTIPSLMSRMARVIVEYRLNEIQEFVKILLHRKDDFIEMLKAQFFWKIYRSTESGVSQSTWDLFNQYLEFFPDSSASPSHSKVLGLAERLMKENNTGRFYNFFKRWNPEKLRGADWQGENGENYKSLAVKSLKRAKEAMDNLSDEQIGNFQWLIDLYGTAIEKFPNDWNIRSKALLHLRAGQLEAAKDIYTNLCMKMGEKFYIWSEFADCWEDPNIKIALLCKALSIEKNEDFLGKIRIQLAQQLIKVKKYENAVIEINRYKTHYAEKGWRMDSDISSLLEQCSSTPIVKDNNEALYAENISIAENRAYADIPFSEVVLVEKWKNGEGKTMMFFSDGETIEFVTNERRFPVLRNYHEGKVLKFKLYKEKTIQTIPNKYFGNLYKKEENIKYIPLSISVSEKSDWQILPIQYGYVQYVNTEKKVYHIYSTDSALIYENYARQELKKGDFVKCRQYKKKIKEETKIFFCDIQKCNNIEALGQFKCGIVVVDDVNYQRQLFHFVLDKKQCSGILHYEQTDLRPSVGDCIKIHYFVRKIDDKKNPGKQRNTIEVLKAEATDDVNIELIKQVSGYLKLKYRDEKSDGFPDFAFVDDCYVHKSILEKYNIDSDCDVNANAIYTGEGKWKVYKIDRQ